MNIIKKYTIVASTAFFCTGSMLNAQTSPNMMDKPVQGSVDRVKADWEPSLVNDGVYDRVPHVNSILPWQHLREADVMWSKRVWREIDIRQKQNMAFRYPGDDNSGGGMFIEILLDAVKKGKVKAYSTVNDRFTSALTKDQVMEMLQGRTDTTPVTDAVTGEVTWRITHNTFNPDVVTKFRLKEDWVFDRNLGRRVVRIRGIAPLIDKYSQETGQFIGSAPMFWIFYEEARPVLAQYEVFNPENDVARMTWDEFFENRYFASYITKVSNPFDQTFSSMGVNGTDALYEGQRVSEELFNKEHDMWVY